MKYLLEAKPPLTRSDVFSDGWEVDTFHAESDEKAVERIERIKKRHAGVIIRLSCEGRTVRTFK